MHVCTVIRKANIKTIFYVAKYLAAYSPDFLRTYTCGMGIGKCSCLIASRVCGQLVMCGV